MRFGIGVALRRSKYPRWGVNFQGEVKRIA